ncbi:hypothetical protein GUJ93_ZPchr0010g9991 [Zizania palustris]|uniref:Uncharacterized protein n=1 Tax=Zizania palustris TaxID=103762 RepID=A0A8J5WCQ6_ZIZPA|nr:hypothetical protein GUJ93_ZPchr0010g9991 [Zizania palustris]
MTPLVQLVEATDEELLAGRSVLLFSSSASDDEGVAERILDMKGTAELAGGGSVDFPVADADLVSMKLLFDFGSHTCNSISIFKAR